MCSQVVRRVCGSHERWRGRLHKLTGERVDVPADVQPRVHSIRDIILQCWDTDRRDVLCESMRRVCSSHERWRGRLHQLPGERVDVPADVQLGVHGIGDELVQCWDFDSGDV